MMEHDETKPESLIRIAIVCARTTLSKPSIYKKLKDGCFPAPVRLGPQSVAWVESEISAWIDARKIARLKLGATGAQAARTQ